MNGHFGLRLFGTLVWATWTGSLPALVILVFAGAPLWAQWTALGAVLAIPVLWVLFVRGLNWHLPPEEDDLPVGDRMNVEEYTKL